MPASEFSWDPVSRGQIFPVFGNKRKASEDSASMEVHNCAGQDPQEQNAKRRCHWSPEHQQVGQNNFTQNFSSHNNNNNCMTVSPEMSQNLLDQGNGMEMNHNSNEMEDQHVIFEQQQKHHQITHPALSQVLSQQPPRVPSPWPSHQPIHQTQSQDQYIMDVNGETYNQPASAAAEMEAAQATMDSDYCPNPQQYQSPRQTSPNSDFCSSYCGVGEQSPSSGRIRCYCKPSWEGMLDMKPYVSDVY